LPSNDHDCASRWRAIKIAFSREVRKSGTGNSDERAIWTRHYQVHPVADHAQYCGLVDYVHCNPVRHGLCRRAEEWPWSSLHRFIAAGYPLPD
jgi:putative transposase